MALGYVKPQHSGISSEQAKQICGCFDCFVFIPEQDLYEDSVWKSLLKYQRPSIHWCTNRRD
jgi:hypothetical protein